jgi:hypothetical protein
MNTDNTPALSEMNAHLRDLVVQLRRGNDAPAQAIVKILYGQLNSLMQSGLDPAGFAMYRAQQTMFALDEVRTLLAQHDLKGATDAARDADREWNCKPRVGGA